MDYVQDIYYEELRVGDEVICATTGRGDMSLNIREVIEIDIEKRKVKLKGMQKWRTGDEVISTKPHKEKYPERWV